MMAPENQPICMSPDKLNLFRYFLTLLKVHRFTLKTAIRPWNECRLYFETYWHSTRQTVEIPVSVFAKFV